MKYTLNSEITISLHAVVEAESEAAAIEMGKDMGLTSIHEDRHDPDPEDGEWHTSGELDGEPCNIVVATVDDKTAEVEREWTKVKAVSCLMAAMDTQRRMADAADMMLASEVKANPLLQSIAPVLRTFLAKFISWDAVRPSVEAVYLETFSHSDITEMFAFYESPVGTRLVAAAHAITSRTEAIFRAASDAARASLANMLQAHLESLPPAEVAEIARCTALIEAAADGDGIGNDLADGPSGSFEPGSDGHPFVAPTLDHWPLPVGSFVRIAGHDLDPAVHKPRLFEVVGFAAGRVMLKEDWPISNRTNYTTEGAIWWTLRVCDHERPPVAGVGILTVCLPPWAGA